MSSQTSLTLPLNNRYFIFRHGRSLANEAHLIVSSIENGTSILAGTHGQGWGLSDHGKQQVYDSATKLADYLISTAALIQGSSIRIYMSPFLRTKQTAAIIHSVLYNSLSGVVHIPPPVETIALCERFFGDFELKSDENYKIVWNEDAESGLHHKFGVESCEEVRQRTVTLIRELDEAYPKTNKAIFILVSHGDALQILQTAFENVQAKDHRKLKHLDTAGWREMKALVWKRSSL